MYILDSDIFSLAYTVTNPNIPLRNRIARAGKNNIFLSIVTVKQSCAGATALVGRYNRPREPRLVFAYDVFEKVLRAVGALRILPFDEQCYAIQIDDNQIPRNVKNHHPEDSRIAATALRFDMTLVTRNTDDYEGIQNLRVENWMDNPPAAQA